MADAGALSICGFGLDPEQVTLETIEALESAEIVFTDALDAPSWRSFERFCGELRDLNAAVSGLKGRAATERKTALVMEALTSGRRAVVLNYGHATFLSSLAEELIAACRKQEIPCRVFGAVSSLGGVFSAVEFAGLWSGLHLYDADNFRGLIRDARLDPTVPTAIVKIGYLLKPEQAGRLPLLIKTLKKAYPPGHRGILVECPWLGNPEGRKVETSLERLGDAIRDPNEFLSLFIPPVSLLQGPRENKSAASGSLQLCGFGLDLKQITLETIAVLGAAEIVFSDALDDAASRGRVRGLCRDFRDLNELSSGSRGLGAAAIKAGIVLEALRAGRRVAVLNYGHPTFLSSLSEDLIAGCRELGIPFRVVNAVSSLDGIFSSLGYTGLWNGLHLYDADDFRGLIRRVALQPSIPTVIVKIGYLLQAEQKGQLALLSGRLKEVYPPEHRVVLVECPWQGNKTGRTVETVLENLEDALEHPNVFVSLYIPPLPGTAIVSAPQDDPDGGQAERVMRAATAYLRQKNFPAAEDALEKAFVLGDGDGIARRLAELNEDSLAEFAEEFERQLLRGLEIKTESWWRPFLLGLWRVREKRFAEAEDFLSRSLAVFPGSFLARKARAKALLGLGRRGEAAAELEAAAGADPGDEEFGKMLRAIRSEAKGR